MTEKFDQLAADVDSFVRARGWYQFHAPKNLAMALSVEAAELLEHFQWVGDEESRQFDANKLVEVGDEMSDVLIYLIRLADEMGVDLLAAAQAKLVKNAVKYPVEA